MTEGRCGASPGEGQHLSREGAGVFVFLFTKPAIWTWKGKHFISPESEEPISFNLRCIGLKLTEDLSTEVGKGRGSLSPQGSILNVC